MKGFSASVFSESTAKGISMKDGIIWPKDQYEGRPDSLKVQLKGSV